MVIKQIFGFIMTEYAIIAIGLEAFFCGMSVEKVVYIDNQPG